MPMRTEKGDWELYVFDTLRAIWLREDATHALDWSIYIPPMLASTWYR